MDAAIGAAEVLRQVPFLSGLPDSELAALASLARRSTLRRGELLWRQGDPVTGIWVIVSGAVVAERTSPGGALLIFHVAGPFETPGHLDLVDDALRSSAARVVSDSDLLFLPAPALRRVMATDRSVALGLLRDTVGIVRLLEETVADLAHSDLTQRLSKLLLQLHPAGTPGLARSLTQGDLAAHLAAARQSVNQTLRMLAGAGLVVLGPGGSVLDLDREGAAGAARFQPEVGSRGRRVLGTFPERTPMRRLLRSTVPVPAYLAILVAVLPSGTFG